MKKILLTLVLAVGAFALVANDAEARRLGGGGSIGRQSQNVSRQYTPPSQAARPAPSPAAAPSPTSPPPKPAAPWKGIAGGLLGGLALGALFSHLGMGGMMGGMGGMLSSLLTIALVVMAGMFIFRLMRGKQATAQPSFGGMGSTPAAGGYTPAANSYAQTNAGQGAYAPEIGSRLGAQADAAAPGAQNYTQVNQEPWGVPADFDSNSFLRNAKTYFIRLQAAWDKADINDIHEFTTPEMYAEIKMQIQERGASPNTTDVVSIDAQLLGVETVGNTHVASVKFSGMIREAANAPAEAFAEVWNLSKPLSGNGGWVLAGIQQIN